MKQGADLCQITKLCTRSCFERKQMRLSFAESDGASGESIAGDRRNVHSVPDTDVGDITQTTLSSHPASSSE